MLYLVSSTHTKTTVISKQQAVCKMFSEHISQNVELILLTPVWQSSYIISSKVTWLWFLKWKQAVKVVLDDPSGLLGFQKTYQRQKRGQRVWENCRGIISRFCTAQLMGVLLSYHSGDYNSYYQIGGCFLPPIECSRGGMWHVKIEKWESLSTSPDPVRADNAGFFIMFIV